jgi:hypothetical protein
MKKLFKTIWAQIKYFIVNPFWVNKFSILLIGLNFVLNGLIWYLYLKNYQSMIGFVPIAYSSAVILLNIFLAAIIYRKEISASFILLGAGMMIQLIYLVFLKFFAMGQSF